MSTILKRNQENHNFRYNQVINEKNKSQSSTQTHISDVKSVTPRFCEKINKLNNSDIMLEFNQSDTVGVLNNGISLNNGQIIAEKKLNPKQTYIKGKLNSPMKLTSNQAKVLWNLIFIKS